ncbi:MAG: hypothetical protein ABH863_01095 [Candidatus Micrarchaeota archaeon]
MKSTFLIEDKWYQKLVNNAMERYGSAKNISAALNEILKSNFSPRSSMFGKLKRFSLRDLRDKDDRIA